MIERAAPRIMKKTRVLVLFGGRSAEHEVSVVSARSVCAAIDRERYDVVLAGITREGHWLLDDGDEKLLSATSVTSGDWPEVRLAGRGSQLVAAQDSRIPGAGFDVVFPLLHGPYGEDGTIQGLLELANVAYVGAGVSASAAGMDKALARAVFRSAGLSQTDYTVLRRSEWRGHPEAVLATLEQTFDYPLFVKPVNLGSSVGITKAHNSGQLSNGLNLAAKFDTKMMIEASVEGARELECAVLGNDEPLASGVGEIIPGAEFYDYNTKYIDDRSELRIPADLDENLTSAVRTMAVRAFQAIDCSGLARVDFLLRPGGDVLINEINTMPGFTPISMYPKLWQAEGLSYADLIDRLIGLAIERCSDRSDLRTKPD